MQRPLAGRLPAACSMHGPSPPGACCHRACWPMRVRRREARVNTGGYSRPYASIQPTFTPTPSTMRRYRAGDFISGFLSWTRPVRLGGAQINSDFSMRPDLITFPVPAVAGSVAVPSTVDVLVNGSRKCFRARFSQARSRSPNSRSSPRPAPSHRPSQTPWDSRLRRNYRSGAAPTATQRQACKPTLAEAWRNVRRNWGIVSDDYGYAAGCGNLSPRHDRRLDRWSHISKARALCSWAALA